MVHAGCVFVASIHLSRTWMPGSFESVRWNVCVHRLHLGLYSQLKEIWGKGIRIHVNSKGKIPSIRKILLRGGLNPWRCIKQDSEPNTLPTSYSGPTISTIILLLCMNHKATNVVITAEDDDDDSDYTMDRTRTSPWVAALAAGGEGLGGPPGGLWGGGGLAGGALGRWGGCRLWGRKIGCVRTGVSFTSSWHHRTVKAHTCSTPSLRNFNKGVLGTVHAGLNEHSVLSLSPPSGQCCDWTGGVTS